MFYEVFKVALTAAMPVSELRGAIPLGLLYFKLPLWVVLSVSIPANILVPFIFFLTLDFIEKFLSRVPVGRYVIDKILSRARKKSKKIENYEFWGLVFFVAIPLPMTGAWTGATVAYVLEMNPKKTFIALTIGVVIASIVVSILTLTGKTFSHLF